MTLLSYEAVLQRASALDPSWQVNPSSPLSLSRATRKTSEEQEKSLSSFQMCPLKEVLVQAGSCVNPRINRSNPKK